MSCGRRHGPSRSMMLAMATSPMCSVRMRFLPTLVAPSVAVPAPSQRGPILKFYVQPRDRLKIIHGIVFDQRNTDFKGNRGVLGEATAYHEVQGQEQASGLAGDRIAVDRKSVV